jgi:U3 small nucleolar ribonucleoprotein component
MQLKKLMVDSKAVWIDFPGCPGFSVEVANLSRKELTAMRKKCISQKFDRKSRQLVEELDEDKFVKEFTKGTIKNWKGLTLEYLETLMLIELGDQDLNAEVEYSLENAEVLVSNSTEFDTWLNDIVFDLDNFRTESKGRESGTTEEAIPES